MKQGNTILRELSNEVCKYNLESCPMKQEDAILNELSMKQVNTILSELSHEASKYNTK